MEDRITGAYVRHRRAHVLRSCARACRCGFGRTRICAATVRAPFVGVDRGWLGSQAFQRKPFFSASAFNANIGAWNTAAVTTLHQVCAAPGPAARTMAGRARPGLGAVRPVVCGGTADARARAHVQALACARAWV